MGTIATNNAKYSIKSIYYPHRKAPLGTPIVSTMKDIKVYKALMSFFFTFYVPLHLKFFNPSKKTFLNQSFMLGINIGNIQYENI